MLAVARRGDAEPLALDTGLEAGVAALVAEVLGLAGAAVATTGFAAGAGFLTPGFPSDGGESAFKAGLAACFTDAGAFGW